MEGKWDPLFQISQRLMKYLARRVEYILTLGYLGYLLKSGESTIFFGWVCCEGVLDSRYLSWKGFLPSRAEYPVAVTDNYCLYETPDQVSEFPSPVVYPPRHEIIF